jgi:hypothetical protein
MLFHFSEEADIEIFIPRENQNRSDFPAVVWAIDEERILILLPEGLSANRM